MKIIAGTLGRRNIKTLTGFETRPTSDKLRGAIFNALGQFFDGGQVLDLFSGSGAMAIEAISRGFDEAVCVDKNGAAAKIIKENIATLKISDKVQVIIKDYKAILQATWKPFDLIIIDPPYDMQIIEEVVTTINKQKLLSDDGQIVLEFSNRLYDVATLEFPGYKIKYNKKYDSTQIMILTAIAVDDSENRSEV